MGDRVAGSHRNDLLVVGHTNIDRIFEVAELPGRDRTVPASAVEVALGGPAANLARAAAARGLRTALVSRVGPEFPAEFREELRRVGVRTDALLAVPGQRSPSCVIVEDGRGGQTTVIDQGAMADARGVVIPTELIAQSRWVHLGTGPPEFLLAVLDAARRSGRPVSADPAQEIHYRWKRGELHELLRGSELLFGNRAELEAAARIAGGRGIGSLLDRVPLVVGTDGPNGAFAESRVGRTHVRPARPGRFRRITGAGDAFRAGFYVGWLRGDPLDRCLSEGNRAAGAWLKDRSIGASGRRVR